MDGSVNATGNIIGALSTVGALSGSLSSLGALIGGLSIPTYIDVDVYDGEYIVNPDFDSITLQTMNKTLAQNVTVNPIQVESVSNPTGGRTVYIGGII